MAFATVADLEARLGAPVANAAQAQAFLDDATAYLQSEIGQLIEAGTATFTTRRSAGDAASIYFPQYPVRAVTTVLIDGAASTSFDFVDQQLRLRSGWGRDWDRRFADVDDTGWADITITFDYGFSVVPPELVGWCCVLASQALTSVAQGGTIGASGVRQEEESIDDYRRAVTYATDTPVAFSLAPEILDRLRARYGSGVYVTG